MKTNFAFRTLVSGLAYGVAVLFLMTACQKESLEEAPVTKGYNYDYNLVLSYQYGSGIIENVYCDEGYMGISLTESYSRLDGAQIRWTFWRDGKAYYYPTGLSVSYYDDPYVRIEVGFTGHYYPNESSSEMREYQIIKTPKVW